MHRLLAAYIGADATYPDLLNKRKMNEICQNLNYRNRMAQYAGRASVALHTHVNMEKTKMFALYNRHLINILYITHFRFFFEKKFRMKKATCYLYAKMLYKF